MNLDNPKFKYFPASWYPILRSDELGKNDKKIIQVFNTELVIFRDEQNKIGIFKSHCTHMGTSFKAGKVCNGRLQCPLHLREYDSNGKCVNIPGYSSISANSHQLAMKTHEYAGIIFAFLGETPSFSFPQFNKVTKNDISYSKASTYNLNTPYQALIFNGFDTHHLGCIHSREILTEPIFKSHSHLMTAEYIMGVKVNSWYDAFVKYLSSKTNDIFLECYGGNLLIISNKSIVDNILITSVPITYNQSRIFLTTVGNNESLLHRRVTQLIRQWLTTFLGVSFLKPDIKIIENMRPDLRNFLGAQDKGAALFWEYWDKLPRDSNFQDLLRH